MLAGSKQERFELFKREFVDPLTPEANQIPITSYYPTSDYKSVIHEITEAFSFDFQVSGNVLYCLYGFGIVIVSCPAILLPLKSQNSFIMKSIV